MRKTKVLIVEDDLIVSFLHKALLKKHKISDDPLTFKNGKEALDFLLSEDSGDSCYLILLDLNMPVMSGWEFLEHLKDLKAVSRTKVVVVTSSTDSTDRNKAEKYDPVSTYLEKPLLDLTPVYQGLEQLEKCRCLK